MKTDKNIFSRYVVQEKIRPYKNPHYLIIGISLLPIGFLPIAF